jgi:hypothetical protein
VPFCAYEFSGKRLEVVGSRLAKDRFMRAYARVGTFEEADKGVRYTPAWARADCASLYFATVRDEFPATERSDRLGGTGDIVDGPLQSRLSRIGLAGNGERFAR